jgi:ribonuclease R
MRKKQKSGAHGQQLQDPQAQREASRYEKPIASREFILQIITEADHPIDQNTLADVLGLQDEDAREALRRRLNAMVRDGQLARNRRD